MSTMARVMWRGVQTGPAQQLVLKRTFIDVNHARW
jgi:hypothetical protein